jgi:hypothetical protein
MGCVFQWTNRLDRAYAKRHVRAVNAGKMRGPDGEPWGDGIKATIIEEKDERRMARTRP